MLRFFLSHLTHKIIHYITGVMSKFYFTLFGVKALGSCFYIINIPYKLQRGQAVSIHTLYTPPRVGCFYTYLIYSTEGRLFLYIPYILHQGQAVSIHTLYTPPRAGCFYTYLINSTEGGLFLASYKMSSNTKTVDLMPLKLHNIGKFVKLGIFVHITSNNINIVCLICFFMPQSTIFQLCWTGSSWV